MLPAAPALRAGRGSPPRHVRRSLQDLADPREPGGLGRRAPAGRHARAQLVVLAAGRGELDGIGAERLRDRADARGDRQRGRVERDPHAARLRRAAGRRRRGRRRGRASRSPRRPPARGPRRAAGTGAGGGARAPSSPGARSSSTARPAAEAPRSPVTPTRSPGCAPSRPTSSSAASAQPTTVTASISAGPLARSPPAIVVPVALASASAPRCSATHLGLAERRREHDAEVRLAGGGAHGGEVGERAGQRAVPDVLRAAARAEAEVRALDHRVDRRDGERGRRARRRRRRPASG